MLYNNADVNTKWRTALTTFLFLDESGNLDFSPAGTAFYGFGCLTTTNPHSLLGPLSVLRYELLAEGIEIERFHATEDKQVVRNKVFEILRTAQGLEFDAVIIDKCRVPPHLYAEEKFYVYFVGSLIDQVLNRISESDRIVLITDAIPVAKKRGAIAKAFKQYIRARYPDRPFTIVHQQSASHMCLQAADYVMWAIHKKWTHNEMRPYRAIEHMIRGETRVFDADEPKKYY